MNKTKIEWTDATWNPVTGCTPVSEGCANCYAKRMATRLAGRCGYPKDEPFAVTLHPDRLDQPLHWKKPRMIFVCSMGDLFHEDVPSCLLDIPFDFVNQVFAIAAMCPQHTFQILTKRPERMLEYLTTWPNPREVEDRRDAVEIRMNSEHELSHQRYWVIDTWPLPNIWLGVTCENQAAADERIPLLLQCPAAVRFVSIEPMLEAVDVSPYVGPYSCLNCRYIGGDPPIERCDNCEAEINSDTGCPDCGDVGYFEECPHCGSSDYDHARGEEALLDWVIVGSETGPGARPMDAQWARSVRDQCQAAGVAYFMKKMSGGKPPPPDLMVREFPK